MRCREGTFCDVDPQSMLTNVCCCHRGIKIPCTIRPCIGNQRSYRESQLPQYRSRQRSVGFFHMLRDVLIASLNKGQFLAALGALLLASLIVKMSSEDVGKLVFRLLRVAEVRSLSGY